MVGTRTKGSAVPEEDIGMRRPRIRTKGSGRNTDKRVGSAGRRHRNEKTQDTDKGEWSEHGQKDRQCQDKDVQGVRRRRIRIQGTSRDTDKRVGSAKTGYVGRKKTQDVIVRLVIRRSPWIQTKRRGGDTDKRMGSARTGYVRRKKTQDVIVRMVIRRSPWIQTKRRGGDTDKRMGSARTGYVGRKKTQDVIVRMVIRRSPWIQTKRRGGDTDKGIGSARTGYEGRNKTQDVIVRMVIGEESPHTSRAEGPGFEFRWRRDFFWVESYQ